jgi:beta-mannanase
MERFLVARHQLIVDAYTDFIDTNHIKGYAEMARINKPFGFTEYGPHAPSDPPGNYDYTRFLDGIRKNFPRTVFFMSWNAKWSLASDTNVAVFLGSPWVVNRDDLPAGLAGQSGAKRRGGRGGETVRRGEISPK